MGLARFGGVKVGSYHHLCLGKFPKTCLGSGGFWVTLARPDDVRPCQGVRVVLRC